MKKFLLSLVLLLLIPSLVFGAAKDRRISDNDGDVLNINSDGTIAATISGGVLESDTTGVIVRVDLGIVDASDSRTLKAGTDPALRVWSADQAGASDYLDIYHNQTDCIIESGSGNIELSNAGSSTFVTISQAGTDGFALQANSTTDEIRSLLYDGTGNQFIFTNAGNFDQDHGHAAQTDPTLFIHSDTLISSASNQWISIIHDKTDGKIDVGTGNIKLDASITIVGANNNCILTIDDDGTCDAGTEIGEDSSIAICAVCAAN